MWAAKDAPLLGIPHYLAVAVDDPSQEQSYKNNASEDRPADKVPRTSVVIDALS